MFKNKRHKSLTGRLRVESFCGPLTAPSTMLKQKVMLQTLLCKLQDQFWCCYSMAMTIDLQEPSPALNFKQCLPNTFDSCGFWLNQMANRKIQILHGLHFLARNIMTQYLRVKGNRLLPWKTLTSLASHFFDICPFIAVTICLSREKKEFNSSQYGFPHIQQKK